METSGYLSVNDNTASGSFMAGGVSYWGPFGGWYPQLYYWPWHLGPQPCPTCGKCPTCGR
jgi:hypothetical protein